MQKDNERTATATLAVCAARGPYSKTAYLFFSHKHYDEQLTERCLPQLGGAAA